MKYFHHCLKYRRGREVRTYETFKPLPDDKVLDWSKLKQIADDILKCI